jgi:leucyl-tRNA synthetase
MVPLKATNAELEAIALANPRIQEFTAGLTIQKIIVVEKRLVNVVAR